jgi:hypothetical protein
VPLVLKDVILSIGTDDYRKHVSQVTFTPTASTVTWAGLGGNTCTDVSIATWVCALAFAQDWETPDSLSQYLLEHEGETVPMTFAPRSGSGPTFTADVIITPGAIGGTVNAYGTGTVNLGCDGKPTLVPAAAAVPTLVSATPSGAAEGDLVTLTGARFTGTTGVDFGAVPAAEFAVVSDTSVVALVPVDDPGAVSLVVTNATGASAPLSYTRT